MQLCLQTIFFLFTSTHLVGEIKNKEGAIGISKAVLLLPTEKELLTKLIDTKGIEIKIRQVPNDTNIGSKYSNIGDITWKWQSFYFLLALRFYY